MVQFFTEFFAIIPPSNFRKTCLWADVMKI